MASNPNEGVTVVEPILPPQKPPIPLVQPEQPIPRRPDQGGTEKAEPILPPPPGE
jgi:hypothetical protein